MATFVNFSFFENFKYQCSLVEGSAHEIITDVLKTTFSILAIFILIHWTWTVHEQFNKIVDNNNCDRLTWFIPAI